MIIERLPFPRVIDSTMRSSFVACPQKFYWEFLRGMRPAKPNVHLHFGSCFATGVEHARRAFYATGDVDADTALAVGARSLVSAWADFPADNERFPHKSLEGCVAALGRYFEEWPLAHSGLVPVTLDGGRLGVEMRLWAESGVAHPDGGPVYFAGRYDALMYDMGGGFDSPAPQRDEFLDNAPVYIVDEKTTGRLGASWAEQWRMRGQFLGYCWLTQCLGLPAHAVVIRGVCVLKSDVTFAEATLMPSDWQVARWVTQMRRDIERMKKAWQTGIWDWNYGDSCNAYGGCPYLMLCESDKPEEWLAANYRYDPWDPCAESVG